MNEVLSFLAAHGAPDDLKQFGAGYRSLVAFWDKCPNLNWLFWTLEQLNHRNRRDLRRFSCWCARNLWPLMWEERSRAAVETAERHARGDATRLELAGSQLAAVKAAKDLAGPGGAAAAWAAWTACATTLFPSIEAARHAVRRYEKALRALSPDEFRTLRIRKAVAEPDILRDFVVNPFSCTRAITEHDAGQRQLASLLW